MSGATPAPPGPPRSPCSSAHSAGTGMISKGTRRRAPTAPTDRLKIVRWRADQRSGRVAGVSIALAVLPRGALGGRAAISTRFRALAAWYRCGVGPVARQPWGGPGGRRAVELELSRSARRNSDCTRHDSSRPHGWPSFRNRKAISRDAASLGLGPGPAQLLRPPVFTRNTNSFQRRFQRRASRGGTELLKSATRKRTSSCETSDVFLF